MDGLIELLFKYRPVVFERGHVVFGASGAARALAIALGIAAIIVVASYTRARIRGTGRDRVILGAMRALILALILLALLDPALLVASAVPQRNVVGVLVDDSRSMQVADVDGRTRADVVRSLLDGANGTLARTLSEKFIVRIFRTTGDGGRVTNVGDLAFDGSSTRLAPALEGTRQELEGIPLAGLVLVSDGADNGSAGTLDETLRSLHARGVSVSTIGVGRERFAKDIEISRVDAPRSVLQGAALIVNVDVAQRGFGGRTVPLVVEDSGRIVGTQDVTLPSDGDVTTVRVRIPAATPGARLFTVRIAPQAGEMVTANNSQTTLVAVRDARARILYIEGEPRFEVKFLHMAVDDDRNLQLVTLMRTAKDRFFRMSIDDSLELLTGFPKTREELFAYRGIVLGSIEASAFTLDQLRMIADFVSERGGGLLMLGGRKAFAEGGYALTPLADILPVALPSADKGTPVFHEVKVALTPAGAIHPATQIAASDSGSAARWKTMPVVTSVNRITRAKPGATTLLTGTAPDGGDASIVMAFQRYGRGKAIAFPIQDSWLWQMDASMPVGDPTYRTFWRQTLRWLVSDVPERVTVAMATAHAGVNEPLPMSAEVLDRAYRGVNGVSATVTVIAPSGAEQQLPLAWSAARDGEYQGALTPTERGVYRVRVTARSAADTIASDTAFVSVIDPTIESFGAEQHSALLKRIAEETGGHYYTPAQAANVANDLVYSNSGNTVVQRLDLWDMPIVFVVLLALAGGEWAYRRSRGLA
ncbi:MAG TPA: glutamine amidotransferase [Gemmatimonadaceae bacterium]|nr:glutamine amidotransferase [Gemmatimonadaceae bacterium]